MRLVPSPRQRRRLPRRLLAVVAVLLACAVPAAVAVKPIPLDWKHMVGDPSVVKDAKDYVVIATGAKVNRALSKNGKVWKWKSSALPSLPAWAKPGGGDIWAADMEKVGSRYVLYFAAPVRGKTGSSRCIGVATAHSPRGTFVPVGTAPLVCPSTFASVPAAADRVLDEASITAYNAAVETRATCLSARASWSATASASASASATPSPTTEPTITASDPATIPSDPATSATSLPTIHPGDPSTSPAPECARKPRQPQTASNVIGAIDPSYFLDHDGRPYLVYKTDGRPSSIRILPLSADGLHPATATTLSRTLVDDAGVLENPVMVNRGGSYYLFNSYGDYARCSYTTVWRASHSLTNWAASPAHTLLARKNTHKLCGPGGADLLVQPNKVVMYFEAWTCNRSYKPCGKNFWFYSGKDARKHPMRALYAVKLGFNAGAPYAKKYVKGSKR